MRHRSRLRFLLEGIEGLLVTVAVLLTWPLSRFLLDDWGSRADERQGAWPGDDLVESVHHTHTRSISIDASADTVWSWLVQFGLGRAGFYSYELLERLAGIPVINLESIDPALQSLAVGDEIKLHPTAPGIPIAYLKQARHICFGKLPEAGEPPDDPARCWSLYVVPTTDASCRLVSRSSLSRPSTFGKRVALAMEEPIDFIMEQRLLRTVKRLATAVHQDVPANEFTRAMTRLRGLEAAAARNPGEERSHDHITTDEYDAYIAEWYALRDAMTEMEPSTWLAILQWCQSNDEFFGDASYAGVHMTEMGWQSQALTVTGALFEAVARRATRDPASERSLWQAAGVSELLTHARWRDFPQIYERVRTGLRALYPDLPTRA